MRLKTKIFDINRYPNLTELAHAMGISVSQIYRVQEGKRNINEKFIIGAMKTFPEHTFDDLFYLDITSSEMINTKSCHDKHDTESTERALEKLVESIDVLVNI